MSKYVIPIPNEKAGTYRLITLIILALNFFAFGFVFIHVNNPSSQFIAIGGLCINAIPAVYFLLTKKHLRSPFIEISFFISAVLWLVWGNYLPAVLMVIFSSFSFLANKKTEIIFDEEGILYPSFPVKKYTWTEVSQVIWRDDMLTIDLKNNKLFQFAIHKDFAVGFDAVRFNDWCDQRNTDNADDTDQ